jgi:mono/diheme cytochrome c family protein
MNQIKYPAYAMLLVLGIASVALFLNKLSSVPSSIQSSTQTTSVTTSAKKEVKNVAGKNLFQNNCQTCHALDKNLTGPALAGVENRGPWTDRKNLVKWVKNPAAMIAENSYAKELMKQYNGQVMPSFPQLSEEQIGNIFDYIKEVSEP